MQLKSREEKESFACNHDSSHKNSDFCHSPQSGHQTKLQNVISRLRITVLSARPRRGGDGASVAFLSNQGLLITVAIASLLEEEEDFCDTIYSRQYHSIRTCL